MVIRLKIKANASDEARGFIAFGRVNDQPSGFVEDKEAIIFVNNIEERVWHARIVLLGYWRQHNFMQNARDDF